MTNPNEYDIVIIGAGIQGAGVAQAAACHGYRTLVIEQYHQAGLATSSKSSKLIHGGLRYLESGQLKLVKECLDERKTLLKNAPHLVKLIPFYIPVYTHNKRSHWTIQIGLIIYSIFSLKPFSIISKKDWPSLNTLNKQNLKKVFKYYDAQTDDTLLTQSVLESAVKHGAKTMFNTQFINSEKTDNHHLIHYANKQGSGEIKCRSIINCSGPWVDHVQKKIQPQLNLPEIELIAGSHIVINTPTDCGAFYLEAEDGRAVFIMPWHNSTTLIGTTEKTFAGNPAEVTTSQEEIEYLMRTYDRYFSSTLSQSDILDSFSGLRVLPKSTEAAFSRSRESLILQHKDYPELICLVGGKLTAYRASADAVLKMVTRCLPVKSPDCDTRKLSLSVER